MNVQVQISNEKQVAAAKELGLEVRVGQSIRVTSPKGKTPQPCACGCKAMTGGGTWVAGHDAKYKSRLYHAYRSGITAEVEAAKAELKRLGWDAPSGRKAASFQPLTTQAETA